MTTAPQPTGGAERTPSTRHVSLASLGTMALIVICVVTVDRAAATAAHALFGAGGPGAPWLRMFIALTHIVDPLPPLASLGFLILGVAFAAGARGAVGARLFAACAATLVAITVKDQLKYACGRLWPETWVNANPSWIANGAFGFFPFHGGAGWASFPSGHMTIVTAPMVVLMLAWPEWRLLAAVPVLLVAVGLFGADYHFVSDMLAGVLLGSLAALIVWRVVASACPAVTGPSRRGP